MNLSQTALDALYRLAAATGYASTPGVPELEALGLAETGKSRFGHWARITVAGRSALVATGYTVARETPEEAPGPAQAGTSSSDAPSGAGLVGAQQAQRESAMPPPAVALNVGALLPVLMRQLANGIINGKSQGKRTADSRKRR